MSEYAALDVSMEQTAICVVDETGRKLCEGKVATCPEVITDLIGKSEGYREITRNQIGGVATPP